MTTTGEALLLLRRPAPSAATRPAPRAHAPLPPWDPNDPQGGDVHTVQPPELVIPAHFADPAFLRADFNGVMLEGDYTPTASDDIVRNGGVRIISGRWTGLWVPFLAGANTTPPTMIMTPMLILYPRNVQDACLTEHAERAYDDLIIASGVWNAAANGFEPTPPKIVAWAQYVQSWGFRIVDWGDCVLNDPFLQALVDAQAVSYAIPGEEVDAKLTSEQYDAVIKSTLSIVSHGIPVGAHFTAGDKGGWPLSFPRDTFLTNWADYDGQVHLCLQSNVTRSAGSQAATLYYARQRIALGTQGGDGRPAPNSRVCLFETMATAQLYDEDQFEPSADLCDEVYGNLRTLEMLYATRDDDRIRAVDGGFGNGCREHDTGAPI